VKRDKPQRGEAKRDARAPFHDGSLVWAFPTDALKRRIPGGA
jgi:hypothetical protein